MPRPGYQGFRWIWGPTRMAIYARDGFRCVWCQRKVKPGTDNRQRRASLDHWVPVSAGGNHRPDNLLTCCIPCNSSRGDSHPEDWAESCNWDPQVWARIQAALSAPLNRPLGRQLWAQRPRPDGRRSWPEFRHHDGYDPGGESENQGLVRE